MPVETYNSVKLIDAKAADTDGAGVGVGRHRRFTIYYHSTGVTTGATLSVEVQSPNGDWHIIDSKAVTATGDDMAVFFGFFRTIRGRVTGWVDGTHTISLDASD